MKIKKIYSNDPKKIVWRKKTKEFIQKSLSKKEIEESKVLCLPGSEMLEIFEIYDKLKVKRNNIYGIEGNYDTFERLKKLNSSLEKPIKIFNYSIKKFIEKKSPKEKFKVINLDLTGYLNGECKEILKDLTRKNLLCENFILITNYPQGKHSSYFDKNLNFTTLTKKFDLRKISQKKKKAYFRNKQDIYDSEKFTEELNEKVQKFPINIFLEGKEFFESDLFKMWSQKMKNYPNKKEGRKFVKMLNLAKSGEEYSKSFIKSLFFSSENLRPQEISIPTIFFQSNGFYPEKHVSYKYTSSSGSKMLSDMYFFKKINFEKESIELLENFNIEFNEGNINLNLKPNQKNFHKNYKKLKSKHSKIIKEIGSKFPRKRISI